MTHDSNSTTDPCQLAFGELVPAQLVGRDNRFRVRVELNQKIIAAHLPNSGRLGELLVPGREVWLAPAGNEATARRKTAYDLMLVNHDGRLVSVDARLPSSLVAAALSCGRLLPWQGYRTIEREVTRGASRLDLRLDDLPGAPPCWIEVKSVTLVKDGVGLFPDAPTARGRRHVQELIDVIKEGQRAAVIFVVQREDVERFSPHPSADPAFGAVLRNARAAGVDVVATRCRVTREAIEISGIIPVSV